MGIAPGNGTTHMIRYDLHCPSDHGFESWFQSASAYDALRAAGQLACPVCGSSDITKVLMAPMVRTSTGAEKQVTPGTPEQQALAALRKQVEENSEYVGMNFVTEARRIHDGDAPERAIYGEAKPDEARRLIEDGVPVAPLPFRPVRKSN
jgi:hypothetical protein